MVLNRMHLDNSSFLIYSLAFKNDLISKYLLSLISIESIDEDEDYNHNEIGIEYQ